MSPDREPLTPSRHSSNMQFTKMQGVGNDFVVVNAAELDLGIPLPDLAKKLCDRKFGIGADGLLVVSKDSNTRSVCRMQMFNPDGTEDMCGNGLRCVSLWAYRAGWLHGQTQFTVAALDGPRTVELLSVSEDERTAEFRIDMGVPLFDPKQLPMRGADVLPDYVIRCPLMVDGDVYEITVINTGSTHTVIFGTPPTEKVFQTVSPLIENERLFPERTSVLWATLRNPDTIDIRIWERGAGETLGCGTGACAVGVAAVVNHLAAPNTPLDIVSKGGTLRIVWPGEEAPVSMTGPAQIVYEGDFANA